MAKASKFPMKVELHVHLDGCIHPDILLQEANKKGGALKGKNLQELRDMLTMKEGVSTLDDLLRAFATFMPLIAGDRQAIRQLAYVFCEDCAREGVRYVEARFSPQLMASDEEKPEYAPSHGDLTPEEVTTIILEEFKRAHQNLGLTAKVILCCIRHRPDWSKEVARLCIKYKDQGVVAIDIAGHEEVSQGNPKMQSHLDAFKMCEEAGVHRTAHASEVGPPEMVEEALDVLKAERIGHGYRSQERPPLYQRLVKSRMHLEACPVSSLCTGGSRYSRKNHPILKYAQDNANFSISTDDPIVLNNKLADDYATALDLGLTEEQVIQSIFSAAKACFAPEAEKEALLKDLAKVYGDKYL